MNQDIRNWFSKPSNKDNSSVIKKKDIDLSTDIKEIQPKTKTSVKRKANEIFKVKEEITTPKKKTHQTPKKKDKLSEKKKPESKKRNLVIDDDDDIIVEAPIEEDNKKNEKAGKEQSDKIIIEEKNTKINFKPKPKEEKKEILIPINVNDFFSGKKIVPKAPVVEQKKEEQIHTPKKEENNKIKEEDKKESNNDAMDIDEADLTAIANEMFIKKPTVIEPPKPKEEIKPKSIQRIIVKPNKQIESTPQVIKQKEGSSLWSDKHRPKSRGDIVGNFSQINNLINWLDNWENCVIHGIKRDTSHFSKDGNLNARAAIISGPPGIGKTSTVRVLAEMKGYHTFELNASDKRNKDIINNSVGFLMNNTTLSMSTINNKNLIIMDEVDGMAGNEDKGGIKALIDIVKKTKTPIVFICNDIYCQKLKSLLNYCYDIRFTKPEKKQIINRLVNICREEKMNINEKELDFICESFGCDIRQILNYLELASKTGKVINCEDYKKDSAVTINSFDVCKKMLTRSEFNKYKTYNDKMDLFFIDFELVPNLIYENYISCYNNSNSYTKRESLERLTDSIENISISDIIERRIKTKNDWSLLPNKGLHSTVIPSMISSSFIAYPKFPSYYSKISSMKKTKREVKDLKQLFPFASFNAIKNEISPLIFNIIMNILIDKAKDGIDEILNIFTKLKMSITQFKETLFDLQTESAKQIYNKMNTGVKSALTKKLNEHFKTSIKVKKSKKEGNEDSNIKRDSEGNIIEVIEEEEEESEDDIVEAAGPTKKKGKKTKNK